MDTKGIEEEIQTLGSLLKFDSTEEFDEDFLTPVFKKLLTCLKDMVDDKEIRIIDKISDNTASLLNTTSLMNIKVEDEKELVDLNEIGKSKLLLGVIEPQVDQSMSSRTGRSGFRSLFRMWATITKIAGTFLDSDVELRSKMIKFASLLLFKFINRRMKKVTYKRHSDDLPVLYDENGIPFHNWDRTIEHKVATELKLFPKTKSDIIKAIKYAKKHGIRVKAAGTRHSWNDVFIDENGGMVLCLLPESVTNPLLLRDLLQDEEGNIDYDILHFDALDQELNVWFGDNRELCEIEMVAEDPKREYADVKVGAAALNFQILKWCIANGYTIPTNVIMLLNTIGGLTSMMCHGSGIKQQTISDLVREVEFVDASGEIRVVNDPDQLKAVAGSFGLFGVILSLTLRFPIMTYAKFDPKSSTSLMSATIPHIPETNNGVIKVRSTRQEQQRMLLDFSRLVEENYYNEFFWFPGKGRDEGFWMNNWNNDGSKDDHDDAKPLLPKDDADNDVHENTLFAHVVSFLQRKKELLHWSKFLRPFIAKMFNGFATTEAIKALPTFDTPQTLPLTQALHFQAGVHYAAPQNCMEIQIPIPSLPNDKPDWSIPAKAWWDIVDIYEKEKGKDKIRSQSLMFVLEMRIFGDSDMIMAPSKGNKHGTVAIEILSTKLIDEQLWENFMSRVASKLHSYQDHDGVQLKTRFHWAKQIPKKFDVNGVEKSADEHIRDTYATEMEEFCKVLDAVSPGKRNGAFERFGNKYLDRLFRKQLTSNV